MPEDFWLQTLVKITAVSSFIGPAPRLIPLTGYHMGRFGEQMLAKRLECS